VKIEISVHLKDIPCQLWSSVVIMTAKQNDELMTAKPNDTIEPTYTLVFFQYKLINSIIQ